MQTRVEWFRKTSWSAADALDFEQRLGRSRGQRTQYLKLQAWHLAETHKPSLAGPAIDLAHRYLQEEPAGIFETQAHLIIATARTTLNDIPGAIQAFRAAIAAEVRPRQVRCCAYIQFAWFVATNGIADQFDFALESIEAMEESDLTFPLAQYRYFGALALISAAMEDHDQAKRMAQNALVAQERASPFPRHKGVGVVNGIDPTIQDKLRHLAA